MHIEAGERHAAGGVGPVEVATTTSKALRGIIYHNLTIRMLKGLPLIAMLKISSSQRCVGHIVGHILYSFWVWPTQHNHLKVDHHKWFLLQPL